MTRLIGEIDTSDKNTVSISFSSVNKDGVTGAEKMMASELIQTFQLIKGFPKIAGVSTGDDNISNNQES